MRPCPKPELRKVENAKRLRELRTYRREQYLLAAERDRGLCHCGKLAVDIHHVYGRGRQAGDWREHYEQLRCVCRECHPHGYEK